MNAVKIVIVDYDVGNICSISSAINQIGFEKVKITREKNQLLDADAIILPGVGSFKTCYKSLKNYQLGEFLNEAVLHKKIPILGICVGMQLLATTSTEDGIHEGLNWIPGKVLKLPVSQDYVVPHVGWNDVKQTNKTNLFNTMPVSSNFYFDHSYQFECDAKFVYGVTNYGTDVAAVVGRENIWGVQFHPEKSQRNGLRFFRNFFNEVL